MGKMPMETTVGIMQRVTFPILATIQNEEEHLISVYKNYIKVSSILIFFSMFMLAALAKPIIQILLTEKWDESIIYLQLYCLSQMLAHISRINLNLLQVKGRSDIYLRLEIIKKTISLAMILIAAPFGILEICFSQIVYSWIAIYLNTYYTGKIFNYGFWLQIKDFFKYLYIACISCAGPFLLVLMDINNYVCIVAGPVMAILTYSLLLRNDAMFIEVRDLVFQSLKIKID